MAEATASATRRIPARLVGAVCLGTLLNPLNSSMIAVALLRIQDAFDVGVASVAWLISAFYLTAAVAQPLMGRIADQWGARRVYCTGLVIVGVTGALAPFAPSLGWLVAARVLLACGTSVAFPCALILIRAATADPQGRPPAGAMGALSLAASVSASLGPVLGGFLVSLAGWQAIFLVNVPVTAAGLVAALAWLPAGRRSTAVTAEPTVHDAASDAAPVANANSARTADADRTAADRPTRVDVLGVLLFAGTLAALLGFLLSMSEGPAWVLLAVCPVFAVALLWWERRVRAPFLDVRMLATNRRLTGVYLQFVAVNLAFYGAFFGVPLWLEQERGMTPRLAGLLLLPIAGIGLLATPTAVWLINRTNPRNSLVVGSVALCAGSLLLFGFGTHTPIVALVATTAVLGIPNAFNNLGLQSELYNATPPSRTGAAAGLFQTSRYVGAILSTSMLGLVFGHSVSNGGLHTIALFMTTISVVLIITSVLTRRLPRHETRR